MSWKRIDRLTAAAVFLYALVLYALTVAPTASFWDAGEFIASVHNLEVMHPPGAPFYMLLGRFFSMFVPTAYVALSVNLISVLASAGTVLLAHLTIVRLVREWQPPQAEQTAAQRVTALTAGVVGACAFAATDSFWFNAVEAEVYALSMFFTAAVVWLVMRWSGQVRAERAALSRRGLTPFGLKANRYLVLIAYLFGLAIGVHLLNLLALFFVALIVYFTLFDRPEKPTGTRLGHLVLTGLIASAAFFVIYPGVITVLPELAGSSGAPLVFFLAVFAVLAVAVYITQKKQWPAFNLVALCLVMVLAGYSTYALIYIRSAADPPIDLMNPETSENFVSYLKREQYGSTPLLTGPAFDDATGRVSPSEEKLFPRRYSPSPMHARVYARYDSDAAFFWQYQVGHMYLRYFLWNFAGRASDLQNAPAITGLGLAQEASLPGEAPPGGDGAQISQTPSEKASRNVYFALPLLLGLIGAFYHTSRDWRRAFSVLVLFFITGLGIIVYLNQTPMQPRERDYSYVASFFAFSLWIGIGAAGLLELTYDALKSRLAGAATQQGVLLGTGALLFALVPGLLAWQNYDDHDRSGRYVAPDYAYNMLQSVAPNAILFTNGDNDTYPLWYLQEVEGVRTDVRVVNLSLLQTPWYIKQLKNQQARDSAPLPIDWTDAEIENLVPEPWQPREVQLPVPKEQMRERSEVFIAQEDTSRIESPMTWTLEGQSYSQDFNVLYVNDQAAYNIIRTNAEQGWERPIYFAVTVGQSSMLNLQNYLQLEGQAMRVVPVRHEQYAMGRAVPGLTTEHMKKFKYRNLDDPDVYYDSVIRNMIDGYRNVFSRAAEGLVDAGDAQNARALLDTLSARVPFSTIPGDALSRLLMARAYQSAGAEDRALALMKEAEPLVLGELEAARSEQESAYAAQYVQMIRLAYLEAGDYEAASALSGRLSRLMNDASLEQTPDEIRRRYEQPVDTAAAPSESPPSQPSDGR